MALQKLQNVDAFVVRDFDVETPAIGIVRSAPKVLQGGAKELARSQTYQCAVPSTSEFQGGIGRGQRLAPRKRAEAALASFSAEVLPFAAADRGELMLDPGKGRK